MPLRSSALVCVFLLVAHAATAQDTPRTTSAPPKTLSSAEPMAEDAHPSFAVATIKPHDPDDHKDGVDFLGDGASFLNESVVKMITVAYAVNKNQIVDAPDWAKTQAYDIAGKSDVPGEPTFAQAREMLQKLLADRFALKFHHEQRELPVYALRLVKSAPKFAPSANPDAKSIEHAQGSRFETTQTYINNSMADFILIQQFWSERPIVDQTGLTGRYDFTLHYGTDQLHNPDPNPLPGLFTAIQDELGLKLEPTRAPVDVIVIDHVEQPSAN